MKVGAILPLFSGNADRVLEAAREAEALGFDGAFVFDHFFPPGASPDRDALEAFTTLAAIAEATERVSIGTLVTRASIRPTGLLAKMAAQIDQISGGRLVLGVGTGDPIDEPEHQAFGFPTLSVADRRQHLEETIRALKALFAGASWTGGERVPAITGSILPPPEQPGGPPLWIGAQADTVVSMAGTLADGWNGWGMDADRFARKMAVLRAAAAGAGRDPERDVEATWAGIALVGSDEAETASLIERRQARGMGEEAWTGTVAEFVAFARALEVAGASWVIIVPAGPKDRWDLLGTEVVPALHEVPSGHR